MISKYTEILKDIPAFSKLSKFTRQKLISGGKKIAIPRGWTFNSE
jgi:hypothetical protein